MTLSWPNHLLTLEEWAALPESEGARLELAEGVLVMSPKPFSWHQHAVVQLARRCNDELPRTVIALADVELVVTERPPTVRVPDVVVTRTALYETNPPRLAAADVLLAVEVLSDGTRRTDRVLKLAEYAEAAIPRYWIVDLGDPATLLSYVLVDGSYELSGEHTGTAALEVDGHPVTVDLDGLARR